MRRFLIFVFLAILWLGVLILTGCATDSKVARIPEPPPAVKPPPIQAKAPELPSELPALQSLPKPNEMEEGIFKERLYSLSYREAEVRDVLMAFSRESSYNIIVDPEVSGKVTVDLKKVTLARALDSLIRPLGLDFKQEGRFIYIVKPKMETRMYHLNYLAVKRSGSSVVSGTGGAGASTTTTSAEGRGPEGPRPRGSRRSPSTRPTRGPTRARRPGTPPGPASTRPSRSTRPATPSPTTAATSTTCTASGGSRTSSSWASIRTCASSGARSPSSRWSGGGSGGPGARPDGHDVQSGAAALRAPRRGDAPGGRVHREVLVPDRDERRPPEGRRGEAVTAAAAAWRRKWRGGSPCRPASRPFALIRCAGAATVRPYGTAGPHLRRAPTGRTCPMRVWQPDRPTAALVYLHGIQSHSGWYAASRAAWPRPAWRSTRSSGAAAASTRPTSAATWTGPRRGSRTWRPPPRSPAPRRLAPSVHLLGVSWGGKLALACAAHRPDLYRSLLLAAPGTDLLPSNTATFATITPLL